MTTAPPESKLRIAICGGGIGGLALACVLSKFSSAHLQVDVYEAAGRFKEIGAGVMLWGRTWRILELMGLAAQMIKVTDSEPTKDMGVGFEYRRSDKPDGFNWYFVEMPYGCIRFHRAHFLDVFVDSIPDGMAHFGKRLESYVEMESRLQLNFADGESTECDVLIGCDGIKSMIRRQMYTAAAKTGRPELEAHIEPEWSGTVAYRGLIPQEHLPSSGVPKHRTLQYPVMYCGKNKHVVAYGISRGTVVNVVAFASNLEDANKAYGPEWVTESSKAEMLDCFARWEEDVSLLLERIPQPTKWAIHSLAPLPFYVSGRVALLGDAAHAMQPHLGSGAGQAIEDAYILGNLLGRANRDNIDAVLSAYERTRLPMANHVVNASSVAGKMFEFNDPELGEEYSSLGPGIAGQWSFLEASTPEGELEKACSHLY